MHKVFSGPVLESLTRTGKRKFWKAEVLQDHIDYYLQTTWSQEGSVEQSSTPYLVEPKNLGKANETTPEEQAKFELASLYNKQRDKGYSEDGSQEHVFLKPMLAHKFRERGHAIQYPCFIQPKLDGFRMLTDGDRAWSRGGKEHVYECIQHLLFDTEGMILDGELLLPGNRPLQETSRAAKKFRPGVSDTLEYWVYDYVGEEDFKERFAIFQQLFVDAKAWEKLPSKVRLVPTFPVNSEEEIMVIHQEFLLAGYEGTMIRNQKGSYESHRSPNLQKLKDFIDSEFLVVDIQEGKGSYEGLALIVCKTDSGVTFTANPKGTMEYKADIFQNKSHYIGKYLTVRYQYLSEAGVPIGNTVGIDFRDPEEF